LYLNIIRQSSKGAKRSAGTFPVFSKKKLRTVKIFTALNNIKGITAISDEEKIDGHTSP
jgi:hypothetical protein